MSPIELLADSRKYYYEGIKNLRDSGNETKDAIKKIKAETEERLFNRWIDKLSRDRVAGAKTINAIKTKALEWFIRNHGKNSFHLTQLLTNHGCIASYLFRIGKMNAPICLECEVGLIEDADYVLQQCTAWIDEKSELTTIIGEDLDLPTVITKMLVGKKEWEAVVKFANQVMLKKEDRERMREQAEVTMERVLGEDRLDSADSEDDGAIGARDQQEQSLEAFMSEEDN